MNVNANATHTSSRELAIRRGGSANMREKIKKKLISGRGQDNALLYKLVMYFILLGIGFVYLYPVLFMAISAMMSGSDIINPTVFWLPTQFFLGNFERALKVLDIGNALRDSLFMVVTCSVLQTVSCALAGYAFGRFRFPLKGFWLVVLVATFIIPTQVTMIPRFVMFYNYQIIDSPLAMFLPAALGQGVQSAIIVLIFMQFFKTYPKALDEAASLDGASHWRIFLRVALPISGPAIVVAVLFSFVWYWNETYQTALYVGKVIQTLPLRLSNFYWEYASKYPARDGSDVNRINESIRMAATLITIAPLILLYTLLQKQFVEAIESNGITGE